MKGPKLSSSAALAAASCLMLLLAACGTRESPPAAPAAPAVSALQSEVLKPGEGAAIAAGQMAVMQYTGWLYENSAPDHKGKKFDSSLDAGTPFSFALGTGSVIKGWDQGVLGMKVGERRRLIIPPDLGYGDTGAGPIPPGATLVFDVELVKIE